MLMRCLDRPLTRGRSGQRQQAGSNCVHINQRRSAPMMRNPQCWQYLDTQGSIVASTRESGDPPATSHKPAETGAQSTEHRQTCRTPEAPMHTYTSRRKHHLQQGRRHNAVIQCEVRSSRPRTSPAVAQKGPWAWTTITAPTGHQRGQGTATYRQQAGRARQGPDGWSSLILACRLC